MRKYLKPLIGAIIAALNFSASEAAVWTPLIASPSCATGSWCPLNIDSSASASTPIWRKAGDASVGVASLYSIGQARAGPPYYTVCLDPPLDFAAYPVKLVSIKNSGPGSITVTAMTGTPSTASLVTQVYGSTTVYPLLPQQLNAGEIKTFAIGNQTCVTTDYATGIFQTTGGNISF